MKHDKTVRIIHAALDEQDNDIIARGVIDLDNLNDIRIAEYQREVAPLATLEELAEAFRKNEVPDIELGMRGHTCDTKGDVILLKDPVFVVDGLQRMSAAKHAISMGITPRLGATVHFGTTEDWERKRFHVLNAKRKKVSPNVLLRNLRHDYEVIDMIYKLSWDSQFAARGRVSWTQRMQREQIFTALSILKATGGLHQSFGPGRSTSISGLVPNLQKIYTRIGRVAFRHNMVEFFDIIEACWGIREVVYREQATHLKGSFLTALAEVFARHDVFWTENTARLNVSADIRAKLRIFPLRDPQVVALATTSGTGARSMLYRLLVDHINSGKRSRRLQENPPKFKGKVLADDIAVDEGVTLQ